MNPIPNLRVQRLLEEWRLERPARSYLAYCPRDIVGIIVGYVPLEIWPQLFRCDLRDDLLLSRRLSSPETSRLNYQLISLADGSTVVSIDNCCVYHLATGGIFYQLKGIRSVGRILLAPDPQIGFWYYNVEIYDKTRPVNLCLIHYDPVADQVITSVAINRVVWNDSVVSFLVTPHREFYVSLRSSPRGTGHELIFFDGSALTFRQWNSPEKGRLEIVGSRLYLYHKNLRYYFDLDASYHLISGPTQLNYCLSPGLDTKYVTSLPDGQVIIAHQHHLGLTSSRQILRLYAFSQRLEYPIRLIVQPTGHFLVLTRSKDHGILCLYDLY